MASRASITRSPDRCSGARDVSPLEGLPLTALFVDLERTTVGIEVLRGMNSLKDINNGNSEQVWKEYDAARVNKADKTHQAPRPGSE